MTYKNKILALVLIFSMLLPVLPTKTFAQDVLPIRTSDWAQRTKDVGITIMGITIPGLTLDLIAITLAKAALESILNSTIEWVNSGFEGNPAFVTDPEQFFTNIADGIAGEFIAGSDLGFLCSPFQAQIRLSLQRAYNSREIGSSGYRFQCTLSDVVGNIEGFYDDFDQGGWDAWFSMTQNRANNPYGSYVEARIELNSRLRKALNLQRDQLSWSSGFLSWAPCERENPETGECIERGPAQTPGKIIETQLSNSLGTGVRQFELADEFDELVSALINQLLQRFVFGAQGLFGGGGGGGGGGASPPPPPVGTNPLAPTVTFSADPGTVPLNGASTLTWSSTNASYCVASGGWSGAKALNGTELTGNLTANQTYTLTCTNSYGPISRSVNISVIGGGGFGGGGTGSLPVVTFDASRLAFPGGIVLALLDWTATDATSCTASGGWSGIKALSGNESIRVINPVMIFILSCSNGNGVTVQSVTVER